MICLWSEVDSCLHSHFKWSNTYNVLSLWFSLWDNHGSLRIFPLLLIFFELLFFIFDLLFSVNATATPLTNAMLGPGPCTTTLLIPVSDWKKKPLKQFGTPWGAMNIVSMCWKTMFYNSLVIIRHFTGNGKVSCILATISHWFPNKMI